MITISQLFLYPVKSLRGYAIDSGKLTPTGLEYDRHWMIINSRNQFVTQRKFAKMVLLHTRIDNDQLIISKPDEPDLPPLKISIHNNFSVQQTILNATIWKDTCEVIDEGESASQWLTKALDSKDTLRLVRMADNPRPQSKPELLGAQTSTRFADAAPFLITNNASLKAVNQQLSEHGIEAVPMENFRPNIVIDGISDFAEHTMAGLQHDHYVLKHCYPCQRCVVPTIDINTGERNPKQEPFSLLAKINSMPENAKAPAFGENAILAKGEDQLIHVGDRLQELN